jgi:DNA (cytosine-5)-methyltransferase 1
VPTQNGGSLVAAFMAQHNTENVGHQMEFPMSTIIGKGCTQGLVAAHIKRDFGTSTGAAIDSPLPTITSDGGGHASLVASFLTAYYGTDQQTGDLREPLPTVMSKDRLALVTVNSVEYVIVDIGMRMLVPRELYRAQGFPDIYRIDIEYRGKPLTKTAQVRMVGNSVSPSVAAAILRTLFRSESEPLEVAA